jgi:hypothetical protein
MDFLLSTNMLLISKGVRLKSSDNEITLVSNCTRIRQLLDLKIM